MPEGRFGDAPLELSSVFAEDEGEVDTPEERKARQEGFEHIAGSATASAKPGIGRSVGFQPRVG